MSTLERFERIKTRSIRSEKLIIDSIDEGGRVCAWVDGW
jgi:hypothetical protein